MGNLKWLGFLEDGFEIGDKFFINKKCRRQNGVFKLAGLLAELLAEIEP